MKNIKAWVVSLRLRTLPLALSTILMGSIVAAWDGAFRAEVLLWAALTTLFLQILSNLANDYGDALSGADNETRVGPQRMIQSGTISLGQMKKAIIILVALALISGLTLLAKAFDTQYWKLLAFFLLGLAAIAAAIRYTAGKNPYGYRGLGDIYVFLFFGIVGVAGSYFLHTNTWQWEVLLPASSIGLFSTGVLNLNNIRDIESDRKSGKITMVVRMGRNKALWYHAALLADGWLLFLIYAILTSRTMLLWPSLLALPLFIRNIVRSFKTREPSKLDGELRNLSLSILLFVVLNALALIF
ncbi:MAG TPA: 1,4-dihydroxy-2-naphthoate octaprenyltransferase [Marinilabiliaceae bacterium]|nr:1,4-dihydroxy-2-naphthoate octaprenyltransferase [Marinilabiliaceae bacterium]